MNDLCHCGKPLHYTRPDIRQWVERLIAERGECVEVCVGRERWLVPRHYIALHGLKAKDLPSLGFKKAG